MKVTDQQLTRIESSIHTGKVINIEIGHNHVSLWFQKKTSNYFIMINGKVLKTVKRLKTVIKKLKTL